MSLLSLKIVTPEKKVFEENEFESVSLPTENGEITILPGHVPLVSKVIEGEITARKKGKTELLMTANGFLTLEKNGTILILSDYAVRSSDIELEKIELAKKKAEETMKQKLSEKDFAVAEAELRKTLLELRVAKKRKTGSTRIG